MLKYVQKLLQVAIFPLNFLVKILKIRENYPVMLPAGGWAPTETCKYQ